jgi:hypothetical protein
MSNNGCVIFLRLATPCPPCFIARLYSPALRQRSGHRRFWRCAGLTSCGKRKESGCQSSGRMARTARPRRMHRTDMFRCIPSCRSICKSGRPGRLTGKTRTSCFLPERQKARVPLSPAAFVADHLRPAAKKAWVQIEDGQRFGLHNLRHSLSNWLVNEARAAQGEFLQALGMRSESVE